MKYLVLIFTFDFDFNEIREFESEPLAISYVMQYMYTEKLRGRTGDDALTFFIYGEHEFYGRLFSINGEYDYCGTLAKVNDVIGNILKFH